MSTSVSTAHAETARLDIHELVRQLNSHLGPTLVAVAAGVKDRKLPNKWAKADGPQPGAERYARLLYTHRTWSLVSAAEGDHVARAWFIGANPLLDEITPIEAIRNDLRREVSAAASAFIEDAGGQ